MLKGRIVDVPAGAMQAVHGSRRQIHSFFLPVVDAVRPRKTRAIEKVIPPGGDKSAYHSCAGPPFACALAGHLLFSIKMGGVMARFFYLLVLLVLIGAIAVFAYQNAGPVDVQFLNWGLPTSIAAVAGAAYLLGMVSGWTVLGVFRRSLYRATETRQARQ
jgi:lipopolysaccharide assembly protein A